MRKHKNTQAEAPPSYRGDGCERWLRSDRFFLHSSLKQGMSFAAIGGFLCRHESEVRQKAEEMKLGTRKAGDGRQTYFRSGSADPGGLP
jgi:hypothetical protein